MKTYCCKKCKKPIFDETQIIHKKIIWDFVDYSAECYLLSDFLDKNSFRRYDTSLHEGWYCCSFIVMKMVYDKFDTQNTFLVYTDSVEEINQNSSEVKQVEKLRAENFNEAILDSNSDSIKIVKFGAIWCPPCRMMDQVFKSIQNKRLIENVEFYEVDIDEEIEFSEQFKINSIPFTFFYRNGSLLELSALGFHTKNGAIVGGLSENAIDYICKSLTK